MRENNIGSGLKRRKQVPVENQGTAAWANAEKTKIDSKVNLPCEVQIRNAKEYIDTNQK